MKIRLAAADSGPARERARRCRPQMEILFRRQGQGDIKGLYLRVIRVILLSLDTNVGKQTVQPCWDASHIRK